MKKYRQIHDVWNAYLYGEKIKVVYIKNAVRRKKHVEKLHPELEGIPQHLLPLAIHSTIYGESVVDESAIPPAARPTKGREKHDTEERLAASISRTKSRIYELAMCNEFPLFCTFTVDKEKVKDRYNLAELQKRFSQYIRNLNRGREKKIKYLLIPEKHKDGAWHLHGFVDGLCYSDLREFTLEEHLPYRIRKMLKNGEKVYNWDGYSEKFGYFTATEVKNKDAASAYICKYVTKDIAHQSRESGGHLYFASQGLKRRETLIKDSIDEANEVVKCPFADNEWDFENEYVKIKWIDQNTDFSNAHCPENGTPKKLS